MDTPPKAASLPLVPEELRDLINEALRRAKLVDETEGVDCTPMIAIEAWTYALGHFGSVPYKDFDLTAMFEDFARMLTDSLVDYVVVRLTKVQRGHLIAHMEQRSKKLSSGTAANPHIDVQVPDGLHKNMYKAYLRFGMIQDAPGYRSTYRLTIFGFQIARELYARKERVEKDKAARAAKKQTRTKK